MNWPVDHRVRDADAALGRASPCDEHRRRPVTARNRPPGQRNSSTGSICATSPWSAMTPAGRSSNCSLVTGTRAGRTDRAGLLRRVRQLSARPDRKDVGADRQTPARVVRALHAADAAAAGPATPARLRVADQARGRRHRSLDEADPARRRDPPRHGPGVAGHRRGAAAAGRRR